MPFSDGPSRSRQDLHVPGDKLDDLITKAVELADAARRAFWLWGGRRSQYLHEEGIDMLVDGP